VIERIANWFSNRIAKRQQRREIMILVRAQEQLRQELLADPSMCPSERLIKWWDEERPSGASEHDLDELERRYDLRLPDDFRAYLKAAMPQGNSWDPEGTNWCQLSEIKSVREVCEFDRVTLENDDKQLIFADFLVWCYAWAVDCSDGPNRGKVAVVGLGADHYVADSFNEFVDRYMRDDHDLHG
jgi:SMI1 / KNR4 family (SUKH-1)